MTLHRPDPLALLHDLQARLAEADGAAAARIVLINGLNRLIPFDQAVLWVGKDSPVTASSIDDPDPHAPHVQHLARLFRGRLAAATEAVFLAPADLADVQECASHHGLYVPLKTARGGVLLTRPAQGYTPAHGVVLDFALRIATPEITQTRRRARPGRKRLWGWLAVAMLGLLALVSTRIPVPQTLLVPVEIVSSDVFHVKAPFDGVIADVLVVPGQGIAPGTDLLRLDMAQIAAQLQIAQAEAQKIRVEYEQEAMRSFESEAARARAADASGRLREKTEQIAFLREQLARHTIQAGQGGVAVMPDSADLRGKPVGVGETLLQIADPLALEAELWIPLQTALPVRPGDAVALFLTTRPLQAYQATLRYGTPHAQRRSDGTMGYRARAELAEDEVSGLLGQQGVARVTVGDTTLFMRVMRQPILWVRQGLGV